MHIDSLDELHGVLQLLHILSCSLDHALTGRTTSTFLLNLFVVELLVRECELLFGALDLIH